MSNKLIIEGNNLQHGSYRFTSAGTVEQMVDVTKGTWKAIDPKNCKGPFESLLREAKSNPANLSEGAREWLGKNLGQFKLSQVYPQGTEAEKAALKLVHESRTSIQGAIKFAQGQHTQLNVAELKQGILHYGEFGEKLLSPTTLENAEKAGFKLADMAALRADSKVLKELLEIKPNKHIDIAKVKELLMRNHGSADELAQAIGTKADAHLLANHKGTLAQLATEIKAEVGVATNALRSEVELMKAASASLEDTKTLWKGAEGAEKAIAAAEKQFADAKAAVSKSLGSQKGKEALKVLHADETFKEVMDEARKVAPEFEKHASAAAKQVEAAVKGVTPTEWGFTKKIAPKAEGFMGAVWKNRGVGGKAVVLAGIAAITYAIVSAVGGSGPGKHAESVGKNLEPEMGR